MAHLRSLSSLALNRSGRRVAPRSSTGPLPAWASRTRPLSPSNSHHLASLASASSSSRASQPDAEVARTTNDPYQLPYPWSSGLPFPNHYPSLISDSSWDPIDRQFHVRAAFLELPNDVSLRDLPDPGTAEAGPSTKCTTSTTSPSDSKVRRAPTPAQISSNLRFWKLVRQSEKRIEAFQNELSNLFVESIEGWPQAQRSLLPYVAAISRISLSQSQAQTAVRLLDRFLRANQDPLAWSPTKRSIAWRLFKIGVDQSEGDTGRMNLLDEAVIGQYLTCLSTLRPAFEVLENPQEVFGCQKIALSHKIQTLGWATEHLRNKVRKDADNERGLSAVARMESMVVQWSLPCLGVLQEATAGPSSPRPSAVLDEQPRLDKVCMKDGTLAKAMGRLLVTLAQYGPASATLSYLKRIQKLLEAQLGRTVVESSTTAGALPTSVHEFLSISELETALAILHRRGFFKQAAAVHSMIPQERRSLQGYLTLLTTFGESTGRQVFDAASTMTVTIESRPLISYHDALFIEARRFAEQSEDPNVSLWKLFEARMVSHARHGTPELVARDVREMRRRGLLRMRGDGYKTQMSQLSHTAQIAAVQAHMRAGKWRNGRRLADMLLHDWKEYQQTSRRRPGSNGKASLGVCLLNVLLQGLVERPIRTASSPSTPGQPGQQIGWDGKDHPVTSEQLHRMLQYKDWFTSHWGVDSEDSVTKIIMVVAMMRWDRVAGEIESIKTIFIRSGILIEDAAASNHESKSDDGSTTPEALDTSDASPSPLPTSFLRLSSSHRDTPAEFLKTDANALRALMRWLNQAGRPAERREIVALLQEGERVAKGLLRNAAAGSKANLQKQAEGRRRAPGNEQVPVGQSTDKQTDLATVSSVEASPQGQEPASSADSTEAELAEVDKGEGTTMAKAKKKATRTSRGLGSRLRRKERLKEEKKQRKREQRLQLKESDGEGQDLDRGI